MKNPWSNSWKAQEMIGRKGNCIVVKKPDVYQLVDSACYKTKGEGAKKLTKQMAQIHCRLLRGIILGLR